MAPNYSECIHLVRVTTDLRKHRLWIAAAAREEAVALVLQAVPEGWSSVLLNTRLQPEEAALLNMKPGDVRELS
jgi:hypothetical protein